MFSDNSGDIGRTPLIKMDIDTRENSPVCQRPYTLPLKHAEWVKKELNILEAAGIIVRSVSPWASPIVVVPKRSAPGEPPKRDVCVWTTEPSINYYHLLRRPTVMQKVY